MFKKIYKTAERFFLKNADEKFDEKKIYQQITEVFENVLKN